jgi:hypothetical protein
MPYTFEAFLEKQPYQTQLSRFQEEGRERGVFSARWKAEDFANLLDFQVFLFKYSSLLQPHIHEMGPEKLEPFFEANATAEQSARTFHAQHREIKSDAKTWCTQNLSFVDLPWLKTGEHTTLMEFEVDGYQEMIAHGPAGYLTIFVADVMYPSE